MKIFVSLLVTASFLMGVYLLYLKKIPTAAEGTVATQAVSITGVRMDLLQIAKAERTAIGVDAHCMTMDELLASGSMSVLRPERDGYTYSVECSGNDFTSTAHHARGLGVPLSDNGDRPIDASTRTAINRSILVAPY